MSAKRLKDCWPVLIELLPITLILLFSTLSVRAQVSGSDAPPPVRTFIDSNGVDLSTGSLYFADPQLSVGQPGQGGLARVYSGDVFGRDSLTGTINTSGSSTYIVSLGMASYTFSQSGQAFTNLIGDGSTLTLTNSTTYTFVGRDGTIAVFSTTFHGGCCVLASVARLASVTKPNGEVLTYSYSSHTVTVSGLPLPVNRIEAVTNNFGYEIKYLYTNANSLGGYAYPSQILGINNSVDYCAPIATTCSDLTVSWPSVSISTSASYIATVTDNLGRQTTYPQALAQNSTATLTRPSGQSLTITSDASARVASISNGIGTWRYAYATSGSTLTTTVTDPNNHARVVATNTSNGTVLSDTDGVNNKTLYAYDTYGRLQTITRPDGDSIGYTYDGRGNVTKIVNTGKDKVSTISTSSNFDSTCSYPAKCNQPNYSIDGNSKETDFTYNTSTGQVASIIRPAGANGLRPELDLSYSSLYAWYKNSAGSIVQGPSAISLLTKTSQCANAQTCPSTAHAFESNFSYGTEGVANNLLITSSRQGAGDGSLTATTVIAYDSVGNPYTQTDPLGRTSRYRFDTVRQLVGLVGTDPDGSGPLLNRAIRITYECDGSVKSGCDGLITEFEQGTVPSEADSSWSSFASLSQEKITYDGIDRKVTDISLNGSTYISALQFSYDAANRLTCQTQRMNPAAVGSLPASACTLGTAGSAGPDRIGYLTYDNANKLLSTTVGYGTSAQATVATQTYGGDNEVLTRADGNGNLTTLVHDTFNRIYQVEFPTPSNGKVSSTADFEQYAYDNNGNVTGDRRRDGTQITYGYDALNRLTSSYNGGSFGYDNLGRMTSAAGSGITETFGYDGLNRQTSEASPLGTVSRLFDLNGNLTRLTYPDGYYVIYGYDGVNELNGLTDSNSNTLLQKVRAGPAS